MTTTTPTKKVVEPTWTLTQVQDKAAHIAANLCMSAKSVLMKSGDEAMLNEYETLVREGRLEALKSMNVKTPLELVTAIAEIETNVFGSKIEVMGDEKSASMHYLSCAMWNIMEKKMGTMSKECQEKAGVSMQNCVMETAKAFGMKGEVKFGEKDCTVTYTK